MEDQLTPAWADLLRSQGHAPGPVLGSGMEGTVVALGDGLVAKLWRSRSAAELTRLQSFYEAVAAAGPALRTPRIHRVLHLDGACASVETLLEGRPLWQPSGTSPPLITDRQVGAVVDALAALAAVVPTAGMAVLPVLEGEEPFPTGTVPFERSLAALVQRRVERSQGPLAARLPDLDAVAAAVVARLRDLPPAPPRLVHGDLIPANVLVDQDSRPVAVLDFGFLTTVGDPAFDAAVAASVFDMYGPRARDTEALLDAAVADRFGYPAERLAAYRAGYALATSTCYSASGSDGHFAWCLRMLERPDVRAALG
ncbi:phosphotransferase [Nocardioides mesophilus]|uniref:Phosphotransferase n=1 Tax=Nocardioides mesophilus TaxID=433659 RepID=A0A7G9RFA2_9ACTN|nr:phosphotransferase [Nocardioides mesophilus]QNN54277.1 phosphotransferase [Nocardioides mesophilus]